MILESSILFVVVLGSIRLLYSLRGIPFIGSYLSTFVAVLLIYPAYAHVRWRKWDIKFFERNLAEVLHSLIIFSLLALAVFPLFLVGNHFYQTEVFHARLNLHRFALSWENVGVQLLLVALPEEFFFRGYLQTILSRRFSRSFRFLGIPLLRMTVAVPLTSLVFAFAHSFIAFQWWHFAIFFPSLAFGWLREKTNGLIAPILFHAVCNVLIAHIGTVYR